MDSDSLFYLKNQFYLGNYKHLCANPLPPTSDPDYLPTLAYTARSYIALKNYSGALSVLPPSDTSPAVKSLRSLANYFSNPDENEPYLEELRDLSIEVEDGIENEVEGAGSGLVKVAAATAFFHEEEVEEALTTLGAGCKSRDLECVGLIVHIYLSISRADLAKKEYEAAKKWADDSLLIQIIEATIGLAVGSKTLQTAQYIYAEQASAPGSSDNAAIITAKAVSQIMLGQYSEAEATLNEALVVDPKYDEALAAQVTLAELRGKSSESETALSLLEATHPEHPLVKDVLGKAASFDELAANFTVPTEA